MITECTIVVSLEKFEAFRSGWLDDPESPSSESFYAWLMRKYSIAKIERVTDGYNPTYKLFFSDQQIGLMYKLMWT